MSERQDLPPSLEPAPTAYPVPLSGTSARPVWPTVIGVISLVLAGLGLIYTPLGFVDWQAIIGTPPADDFFPEWFSTYRLVDGLFEMVLAALLLTGAICLLRRRPAARPIHLAYGVVSVLTGIIGTIVVIRAASLPDMDPMMKTAFIGGGILGGSIGLAYPVFLLIWFSRATIIREVRRWRDRLDREAMGQQSHPM